MKSELANLIANYALLSLIADQPINEYCYTTDRIRAQKQHYTLQTAHPYDNTFSRPVIEGTLSAFACRFPG